MDPHELRRLFQKAEVSYPHYAITPVSSRIDPRLVDKSKMYGDFLRLPLGNGSNRWCFTKAILRDHFVDTYKSQGAQYEESR